MGKTFTSFRRLISIATTIVVSSTFSFGQAIDSTLTPNQYINNLVGLGVSYGGVSFQGDAQAIGFFTGASGNLGFGSGIIMATGPVAEAVEPGFFGSLDADEALTDMPDLTNMVPPTCVFGGANDGSILEFTFVPQSTPVSFRYIFASDEYPNWVCSQYNDAFAFLISGPGIVGTQNLALVPGTNDPITISTINNGNVGGSGSAANEPCILTNSQYFNSAPPTDIYYNGFTEVLTAVADVIPCSTYTLRLLIADYCDTGLSSAVFLEANSFGAAPISITQTTLNGDSTTYEGCAPATLVFTRLNPDPFDYVFPFTLTGTAIQGVDYLGVPPFVTIPAGQTSVELILQAVTDGIVEGTESIELSYETICGTISTTVFITEPPVVTVTPVATPSICEGLGPVTITGIATTGVAPFTYTWSNGLPNGSSASVNPLVTTTYTLTATDFCGNSGNTNLTVNVANTPDVPTVTPAAPICENENFTLLASTSSTTATLNWSGPNGFTQVDGIGLVAINNATVANSGNYSVFASEFGCNSAPVVVNQLVNPRPVLSNPTATTPACEGSPLNISVQVTPLISTVNWTGDNGFSATGASLNYASAALTQSGLYAATATLNGCDALVPVSVLVQVNDTPEAPTVTFNSPVCAGFDLNLQTTATEDSYTWTGPGFWTSATQNTVRAGMTPADAGNYSLVVTTNNCPSPATVVNVQVIDASFLPQIITNSPVCQGTDLDFSTPIVNGAQYFWSGPGGFTSNSIDFSQEEVDLSQEGNYSLYLVIGQCTTATNTFSADVVPIPLTNAGLDNATCSMQPLQIGTPPLPGHTYSWSPALGLNFSTVSNPTVVVSNVGAEPVNYPFILTTTADGCSGYDTINVLVNPQPIATFETPAPQCFQGHSFDFSAEGIYNSPNPRFVWDFGPGAIPDSSSEMQPQDVIFPSTGLHLVKLVIIDNGCVSNTYVSPVNVWTMPVANFIPDNVETCEPSLINFTDLSEDETTVSWSWDFGNGRFSNDQNPSVLYREAGMYNVSLTVTNINGCSNTYNVNSLVTVNPSPQAAFNLYPGNVLTITDPTIEITDLSNNASDCYYTIGSDSIFSFNTYYTFPDSGNYEVVQFLSNEFGCTDTTIQLVRVDIGYKVYIPGAFTPNDDGNNDVFRIYGEDIATAEIKIFNRWGELLYTSFDPENGWDGKTKLGDKVVPGGVYLYSIDLFDRFGNKYDYDGTIQVLR
jgi:gliding motility-associated-like protein